MSGYNQSNGKDETPEVKDPYFQKSGIDGSSQSFESSENAKSGEGIMGSTGSKFPKVP